jgi:predicted membrane protein
MRYEDEFSKKPTASKKPKRRFSSQFLIGVVVVVIGAALLLDNLGIIPSSREILQLWPAILVAIGLRDLFVTKDSSRAMRGSLLIAFGSLLLLNNFDVISVNVIQLWPLFIILFGIQMLLRSVSPPDQEGADGQDDSSQFDDFALLGGVKRSLSSSTFRGGSASAFMGGVDIDLSRSTMEGDRVVVNVFALMGGIVLRIPHDWAVVSNVTALLGGVEDKTRPPSEPIGTLVLEGSAIMGGIEIKD